MSNRIVWSQFLLYAVLVLLSAGFLVPLAVVLLNSFRTTTEIMAGSLIGLPHQLTLTNWSSAWNRFCIASSCVGIRPYFWNSVAIVVPATLLSTTLGALNGYSLALWRFRGSNWVFGVITLGVFLPGQVKLVPWAIVLREIGLSGTLTGLTLIHVVQGLSFTTLFCRNFYVSVPADLLRAARIDGAGYLRIFWRIVLPLSPPILMVSVVWQFTGIWNEFLYGVTFSSGGSQPVTAAVIALSAHVEQAPQYGVQSAAVLLAAAPPLLVYLFGGRWFVRGLTAGAVK